jgi:predicted DNA-binding transcriptional regulator AlpA
MPMTHQNQNKSKPAPAVRMIRKEEVLRIAGDVCFVTVWTWMQAGAFPRARKVGGHSMWLSTEIDDWLAGLPVRPYRDDVGAGQPEKLSLAHTARGRSRRAAQSTT